MYKAQHKKNNKYKKQSETPNCLVNENADRVSMPLAFLHFLE